MQQQEEETKSFMSGGINGGSVQSQQVLSLMSQVFIGSIFYEVSEAQLRDAFSPFGIINVVNLNLDPVTGKHKGFAFIWFELAEAAQLSIEQMNGANMWGRPIKVGRPTQAQPYLKTIEEAVYDSKRSTCIYVAGIQPVSFDVLSPSRISYFIRYIRRKSTDEYYEKSIKTLRYGNFLILFVDRSFFSDFNEENFNANESRSSSFNLFDKLSVIASFRTWTTLTSAIYFRLLEKSKRCN